MLALTDADPTGGHLALAALVALGCDLGGAKVAGGDESRLAVNSAECEAHGSLSFLW